ncbi:MAG: hypothetical protein BWY77_01639 [bacterium ADurb.Bin431]|nr:MAG: hypothetical protein BWY77_01639 [bacterium ADurb.Bin431]
MQCNALICWRHYVVPLRYPPARPPGLVRRSATGAAYGGGDGKNLRPGHRCRERAAPHRRQRDDRRTHRKRAGYSAQRIGRSGGCHRSQRRVLHHQHQARGLHRPLRLYRLPVGQQDPGGGQRRPHHQTRHPSLHHGARERGIDRHHRRPGADSEGFNLLPGLLRGGQDRPAAGAQRRRTGQSAGRRSHR